MVGTVGSPCISKGRNKPQRAQKTQRKEGEKRKSTNSWRRHLHLPSGDRNLFFSAFSASSAVKYLPRLTVCDFLLARAKPQATGNAGKPFIPITQPGLAEEPHRRIPRAILTPQQP